MIFLMICLIVSFLPSKCRPEISLTQVPGEGPRTERPALTWQPTATHGKRNRETAQLRAKFSRNPRNQLESFKTNLRWTNGSILPRVVVVLLSLGMSTNLVLQCFIISSTQSTNRNLSARILRKKISLSLLFRTTFHGFYRKLFAWGVFSARPRLADHHRG